jgi:hypothetical protein
MSAASTASAAAPTPALGVSAAQLAEFDRDGYLVLPDFFSAAEADRLKAHADQLLDELDLATHPRTIFKTAMNGSQAQSLKYQDANQYFLDSADQIHYFFVSRTNRHTIGFIGSEDGS